LNWQPRDLDELYDMNADPGELHNLAQRADHAARLEQLKARLEQWLEETEHPYRHTIRNAMRASVPA
jgi:arylsulfatase A-like enzyme